MDVSLDTMTDYIQSPASSRISSRVFSGLFLPAEYPLAMPVQNLRQRPERQGRSFRRLPTTPPFLWLRRLFVFGGALGLTAYSTRQINEVFNAEGLSPLGIIVLVLFAILSFWISLSFISCLGGFVSLLKQGGLGPGINRNGPLPVLQKRTAILLPTYNELPERLMVNLRAMLRDLTQTGQADAFDVFILSDTTSPEIWIDEERAFLALREEDYARERVFYRHRLINRDRKSGNIAEWVTHFGGAYDHMLTLDADSVMNAGLIIRLAGAMEAHPQIGLIQSLPIIIGGHTVFARMQQFAGRIYGPLIAHGLAWWHGSEGNYWGHNAIIRTRAFAEQAGLPHLSGSPPFGGHILSHDFVEAALMRRGGWAVHMVPGLHGSYEESPPSLTDIAIRDRRWCQGNLQHGRLLGTRGLHWVSRTHMLIGIGSYIMSPLWLLFLLFGILISLQGHFYHPEYFSTQRSLFPHWPRVNPILARDVFIFTMAVLLAPKILAFIASCFDRSTRQGCGGVIRLGLSIFLETLIGGLIAPIAMLIQTSGILSILMGRDSGWAAQNRVDGRVSLREVMRNYWFYSVFGILLSVAAWLVSTDLFLWMLPVLIGLVLAIPLIAFTASRSMGEFLKYLKILLIPEESHPPAILQKVAEEEAHINPAPLPEAWDRLCHNSALLEEHEANLPAPRKAGEAIHVPLLTGLVKIRESRDLSTALTSLDRDEKNAILANREGLNILLSLSGKGDIAASAPASLYPQKG